MNGFLRWLPLAGGALIVIVSVQLVREKNLRASLRSELRTSTTAWIAGAGTPDLPILVNGAQSSLPRLCEELGALVLYVSREDCRACGQFEPLWHEFVETRDGAGFLELHLDGAGTPSDGPDALLHGTASPGQVVRFLRVEQVPALLVLDGECRIRAAGAGLHSTRLALEAVDRNGPIAGP